MNDKEQAEYDRNSKVEMQLGKLCPMMNSYCNITCVCFRSSVEESKTGIHGKAVYEAEVWCSWFDRRGDSDE